MPPTSSRVQFLTINDFRSGIILNTRGRYLALPPGAADFGTTGCYATPTGALIPCPGKRTDLVQTFAANVGGVAMDPATTVRPTGLFTVGPVTQIGGTSPFFLQNANFADELWLMMEGKQNGTNFHLMQAHLRKLYRQVIPADVVFTDIGSAQQSQSDVHGVSGATVRLNHANFSNPGLPTFVWEWAESPLAPSGNENIRAYPNPAASNGDTGGSLLNIPGGGSGMGFQVVSFSGRVIVLAMNQYNHGLNSGVFYTNEDIFYTDPPNADTIISAPPTVLDADNPSGYGSWGSLNYGELILIKVVGGAIVIDGDIYAPQPSILRGVMSTGNLMNQASPTNTGLIYCVDNDGAYIWEGGNSSRKVSTLLDGFYNRVNGNPTTGVKVKHSRWNNFVAFPNGWLFDTLTESWWNLDVNADIALVEAGKGSPNLLYTAPDEFSTSSNVCTVNVYDSTQRTNTYTWISQIIRLSDNTHIDLTEITIVVSDIPFHGANVVVSVEGNDGLFHTAASFQAIAGNLSSIIRLTQPAGISNLPYIRAQIVVTTVNATEAAPTFIEAIFGYIPSGRLPQHV